MKKIPHNILLFASAVVMVAVIILYAYTQYSIQSSVSRAMLGKQIVNTEKTNINQRQYMMDTYSSTIANREKMLALFIPSTEAISFIESIEGLSSYAGSAVSISSVSSDNIDFVTPNSFAKISAHVEVSGPWMAVMRILRLSETLPYQVSLSNVRVSYSGLTDNTKEKKQIWKLSFDIASNMIVTKNATSSAAR